MSEYALPLPPRTPTPPSDHEVAASPSSFSAYETSNELEPFRDHDTHSLHPKMIPQHISQTSPSFLSAERADAHNDFASNDTSSERSQPGKNPFSFQPTTYHAPRSPGKLGQRRGHKYKHSSVSHHIFLEPEPRAPLRLPASLPVPTSREGWKSMSSEQTLRISWCFCHLFIAAFVQWTAQGSLSLTALSHLIFYDAIGALLCASVEVLSNFEVWKRSSIRQPFGLERSEVLVGFATSILLLFMGFDLISHNLSHVLAAADSGAHGEHRPHNHQRVSAASVDLVALLAVASSLISAIMLQNHTRMARSLRMASISFLPSVFTTPSHLLTVSCSAILLLTPLLSYQIYSIIDETLSTAMAFAMCFLGGLLVKNLGAMLLMSYNGPGIRAVLSEIEADPDVNSVLEARFWQVHYDLSIANLKLKVKSDEGQFERLRDRIQKLIKDKLGNPSGGHGAEQLWEISTQIIRDQD